MEPTCPIDTSCSHQVSLLLKPPSAAQAQKYYEELLASQQCSGIEVKASEKHGKGLYATADFKEGDLVLKEPMLFGIQHSSNKMDAFVCSYCFQFIGSVEMQIGKKLFLINYANSSETESGEHEFLASEKLSGGELNDLNHCSSSNSKRGSVCLSAEVINSLMDGGLELPHSSAFKLPSVVLCLGGCKETYYCSKLCAEADWNTSHSLLCTGMGSKSLSTAAVSAFIKHANETNDIFLLAAKVISFTILRYRKLKAAYFEEQRKHNTPSYMHDDNLLHLLEAWEPVSMGYKKRWWDCISLPDDVDCCDETAFRLHIKELAYTSLLLLKEALFEKECEPLFSLDIYGHIIGMFELNNLDLIVDSPIENYFIYLDDLPCSEKDEAERLTKPFLDALGDDYSICCEGTAFFPFQSCMNHSCDPNAKAYKRDEDRDGQATLIARQPILKGQEITISYVDEELPFNERQPILADYGFKCRCQKCLDEEPST